MSENSNVEWSGIGTEEYAAIKGWLAQNYLHMSIGAEYRIFINESFRFTTVWDGTVLKIMSGDDAPNSINYSSITREVSA